MEYDLISADSHIDISWMPGDLFVSNVPAKWKDVAPQIVETAQGKRWFSEGRDLTDLHGFMVANIDPPPRGTWKTVDRMLDSGFYEGPPHPTTPDLRVKDQDLDGVNAEVIYGILGIGWCVTDLELRSAIYGIYNSWAAGFHNAYPQRLFPLATLPNHDPEAAANELRRAAKLGLKGAELAAPSAVKPIWHKDWDPLWAAAQECATPLSFHETGYPVRQPTDEQMAREYASEHMAIRLTCMQMAGAEFISSLVFSGALQRYPGMNFVLGECGVGWIPYVLSRMDKEYDDQFRHLDLTLNPSEYWRRQGFTTYQHEPGVANFVRYVGEDNVMWGSDYPHPDGTWPISRQFIAEDLAGVDETVRRKLTCDNVAKLYRLPH